MSVYFKSIEYILKSRFFLFVNIFVTGGEKPDFFMSVYSKALIENAPAMVTNPVKLVRICPSESGYNRYIFHCFSIC
ncbi:Uncharacterized protein dnm_074840 [Desulfonema magnum]|uniref:Uncharacterized protein n=1 Tax=Desulfonema magnum TaxID=45655 RepID=A0A975BU82_9BACT|nr:Uncharacterized protein dnm_074840 [Desulfonema magnum]